MNKTTTVPHYVSHKGEAYCQYCLEGSVDSNSGYTLREREIGECINCAGEHTTEDREYYLADCFTQTVAKLNKKHAYIVSSLLCSRSVAYDMMEVKGYRSDHYNVWREDFDGATMALREEYGITFPSDTEHHHNYANHTAEQDSYLDALCAMENKYRALVK